VLITASGLNGLLYTGIAFFTCIEPEHRGLFLSKVPFFGVTLRNALSL
jgi:hypothetical protein